MTLSPRSVAFPPKSKKGRFRIFKHEDSHIETLIASNKRIRIIRTLQS